MDTTDGIFGFSDTARYILQVLERGGYEAWFVGGCVRDALIGREIHDVDIATDATWQEVAEVCAGAGMSVHETGIRHGTVTVVAEVNDIRRRQGHGAGSAPLSTPADKAKGLCKAQSKGGDAARDFEAFEITTYREDAKTSSDARHPDCVSFVTSIRQDLARRDFTINAMAYHPERGLLDIYDGVSDIRSKTIRAVGDADCRLKEDALRILRGCRLMSELGFDMDQSTYEAMVSHKHFLSKISVERISSELDRFLLGDFAGRALTRCVNVIEFVLPELNAMRKCEQHTKYHCFDVLGHTACALDKAPKDRLIRWAVLCHDMGKPASQFKDKDGVDHFYGHAYVSAMLARSIGMRLSMSQKFISDLVTLVQAHNDAIDASQKTIAKRLSRMGADENLFRAYLHLKRADILAHAPEYRDQAKLIDDAFNTLDSIIGESQAFSLAQLAINGNDLLALGLQKGPCIGQILQSVLDAVIEGEVPNDRDALLQYVKDVFAV